MRIASWTVVFGAVAALIYTGFKPFWQSLEFPAVDGQDLRGTILSPDSESAEAQEAAPAESARLTCEPGEASPPGADCTPPTP